MGRVVIEKQIAELAIGKIARTGTVVPKTIGGNAVSADTDRTGVDDFCRP